MRSLAIAWIVLFAAAAHGAEPTLRVVSRDAPLIRFPGAWPREPWRSLDWVKQMEPLTDCNSPVHWVGNVLCVFNSRDHPWRSLGSSLDMLTNASRHLEGTRKDPQSGRLYGLYHNEVDQVQGRGAFEK